MHENRETSGVFPASGDRSGKAKSRTPDAYALEESDRAVVPMKPPNNGAQASAEGVEGRARTKENIGQKEKGSGAFSLRERGDRMASWAEFGEWISAAWFTTF